MRFRFLALILLAAVPLTSAAQDFHAAPVANHIEEISGLANLSYEPVFPGDLLYISVADYADITHTYRISQDGAIDIPVLSEPLNIIGLTPALVEKAISKALLGAKLLVRPIVSVFVLEYRSRPVQISGAVKHPLTIQALGNMRLLDALARCDGLENDAGFEILVLQPGGSGTAQPEQHIPVQALIDGSDPQLNIALHGGEQIRVPRAGKVYVVGNVRSPGAFNITEADGLTVLKVIGLSQGVLPFSRENAIVYRLAPGGTQRTEISVPVRAILKHHAADFPLHASDIFYIPDHAGKRITANVAERIAGVGAVASTIIIPRAVP